MYVYMHQVSIEIDSCCLEVKCRYDSLYATSKSLLHLQMVLHSEKKVNTYNKCKDISQIFTHCYQNHNYTVGKNYLNWFQILLMKLICSGKT